MVLPQYVDERTAAVRTGQAGQASPTSQASPTGQAGQAGQAPSTGQAGQAGQAPPTGQAGQAGQAGEAEQELSFPWNLIASTIQVPDSVMMKMPVDAAGDANLVNRIKTWPKDKQPFWFLNSQAIEAHRGNVNNPTQPPQTQPNSRSLFSR